MFRNIGQPTQTSSLQGLTRQFNKQLITSTASTTLLSLISANMLCAENETEHLLSAFEEIQFHKRLFVIMEARFDLRLARINDDG